MRRRGRYAEDGDCKLLLQLQCCNGLINSLGGVSRGTLIVVR